jgi:TnpA family transposase
MPVRRYFGVQIKMRTTVLDELARGCVELSKIETQWDEMMRVSGSLKLGTVHASELVGSLLKVPVRQGWRRRLWRWDGSTRRCTSSTTLMMKNIVAGY